MICKTCKTETTWRMHECKRNIGEFLGCEKCDNWCTACRPNWNDELNSMHKPEKNKKTRNSNKNVQKRQRSNKQNSKKKE